MMSRLPGEINKKVIDIIWSYCPLQNWTLKTVSKSIISRTFKLGQLKEDDVKVTFSHGMAHDHIASGKNKTNAHQPL